LELVDPKSLDSFGSDLIRDGICRFIANIAQTNILSSLSDETSLKSIKKYWQLINTSLARSEEFILPTASQAAGHLLQKTGDYFSQNCLNDYLANVDYMKDKYGRRGYSMALGYLSLPILINHGDSILDSLIPACQLTENNLYNDAETRRNAVHALIKILDTLEPEIQSHHKFLGYYNRILGAFLLGMNDYSYDSRGDVGSWIRAASIEGINKAFAMAKHPSIEITESKRHEMIGFVLLSCLEKIDRIRENAGKVLYALLADTAIDIPERNYLETVFSKAKDNLNWLNSAEVFPVMSQLIYVPSFRDIIVTGFISNIGGLTESLVRHASDSFSQIVEGLPNSLDRDNIPETTVDDIATSMRNLFNANLGNERISIPLIETLDICFSNGYFIELVDPTILKDLFNILKKELFKSKNTKKLLVGIRVLSGFASLTDPDQPQEYSKIQKLALEKLVLYLGHPYPIVRSR
jgi:hypothetical protein